MRATMALAFLPLFACTPKDPEDTSSDADTDADSDADTDSDSDTDADSDTDSDTDAPFGDEACIATDEVPGAHAPSDLRGLPTFPAGGGLYDPRLSGCTLLGEGGGASYLFEYDADGRQVHYVVDETTVGATVDWTWSDDGCMTGRHYEDTTGTEFFDEWACDNHGYAICWSDGSTVLHYSNTYDELDRRSTNSDPNGTSTYTWDEDGHVTVMAYTSETTDDADYTVTHTWEKGLILQTVWVGGWGTSWESWTYDDEGRALTWTAGPSTVTYNYDEGSDFPSSGEDDEGTIVIKYELSCPE